MKISSMDIYPIRLGLKVPIPMSSGVIESCDNVLVRLTSDDGVVGWGEGVEAPSLTGHHQADIATHLQELRPLVVGEDARRIKWLSARIRQAIPGASTALAAIDIALHDLVARAYGIPAHAIMGGPARDSVPALTLVGSGNPDADLAKLENAFEDGFTWFKIKLGMAPAEDEWRTIATALETVGPNGVICADANGAWDEGTALRFLSGLEGMSVRFVEQPVPPGDDAALIRVAEQSPVPICVDESATSLGAVAGFAGTAVHGVSVKLIKHGGMTGVMRAGGICSVAGLEVNLAGKVIESSISAAANLHCAAALDRIEYGCSPANRGLVLDVTEEPIQTRGGDFTVPTGPGLGVEVDETLVSRLSV